jgi:AmpD protein
MIQIAQMPLQWGGRRTNRPDKIVVHAMGEYIEQGGRDFSAWQWLNRLQLSAHALVTPSGIVVECRDTDERAYHAKGYNRNSLGVEILVPGVHTYGTFLEAMKTDWVTIAAWDAAVACVGKWAKEFDIPQNAIHRHSDLSPGRKFDPGTGFEWERFLTEVQGVPF